VRASRSVAADPSIDRRVMAIPGDAKSSHAAIALHRSRAVARSVRHAAAARRSVAHPPTRRCMVIANPRAAPATTTRVEAVARARRTHA
jgi:hypothetical protein